MDFNENVNKHYGFSPSQASKNQKMEPKWVVPGEGVPLSW
jgi:hypothetical protein